MKISSKNDLECIKDEIKEITKDKIKETAKETTTETIEEYSKTKFNEFTELLSLVAKNENPKERSIICLTEWVEFLKCLHVFNSEFPLLLKEIIDFICAEILGFYSLENSFELTQCLCALIKSCFKQKSDFSKDKEIVEIKKALKMKLKMKNSLTLPEKDERSPSQISEDLVQMNEKPLKFQNVWYVFGKLLEVFKSPETNEQVGNCLRKQNFMEIAVEKIEVEIFSTMECVFRHSSSFLFENMLLSWKNILSIEITNNELIKPQRKSFLGNFEILNMSLVDNYLKILNSFSLSNSSFVIHSVLTILGKAESLDFKIAIYQFLGTYFEFCDSESLKSAWSSLKPLLDNERKASNSQVDQIIVLCWKMNTILRFVHFCGSDMGNEMHEEDIRNYCYKTINGLLSLTSSERSINYEGSKLKILPDTMIDTIKLREIIQNTNYNTNNVHKAEKGILVVELEKEQRLDFLALHFLEKALTLFFSYICKEDKKLEETLRFLFKKYRPYLTSNGTGKREISKKLVCLSTYKALSTISLAIGGSLQVEIDGILTRKEFFDNPPIILQLWKEIIKSVYDDSSDLTFNLKFKTTTWFNNDESKALGIKKLSFLILSSQIDKFSEYYVQISEKLEEILNETPSEILYKPIFLCYRVLVVRSSFVKFERYYKTLFLTLFSQSKGEHPTDKKFIFSICKFIDLLFYIHRENAFKLQWIILSKSHTKNDFQPNFSQITKNTKIEVDETAFIPILESFEFQMALNEKKNDPENNLGNDKTKKGENDLLFLDESSFGSDFCGGKENFGAIKEENGGIRPFLRGKREFKGSEELKAFQADLKGLYKKGNDENKVDMELVEKLLVEDFSSGPLRIIDFE